MNSTWFSGGADDLKYGVVGGIAYVTSAGSSAVAWLDGHGGTYSMVTGVEGVQHRPA